MAERLVSHRRRGFRMDEEGNYFFVDRLKDVAQREEGREHRHPRSKVETEVITHPAVKEAAAVAITKQTQRRQGADRGLACRGRPCAPEELVTYLIPRLLTLHGAALRTDHGRFAQDADPENLKRTLRSEASLPTHGTASAPASD